MSIWGAIKAASQTITGEWDFTGGLKVNGTPVGGGGGDMFKVTYDTDNSGIVDKAETVNDGVNSATAADLSDAVTKKHSHTNSAILNAIEESLTTALKTAYDSAVTWITTNGTNLINHLSNTSNPHSVTKAQVGLSNVDNTSDANKPVSTATQTALNLKQDTLVSGTNIKTVNGSSVLGSGNLVVGGASGTVILIDANETEANGTTSNSSAISYTLAANTYSRIIFEAEILLESQVNTDSTVTFRLWNDANLRRSVILSASATGAGDVHRKGAVLKYSEAIAAGATIKVETVVGSGAGTWRIYSLRVYGVV